MSRGTEAPVTALLEEWRSGDPRALELLTPVVYKELRVLAHSYMRGERAGHLLQTTALVHEAYLKLVGLDMQWHGRVHFFAVAARLMRRVLVDFARERDSAKRGGGVAHLALDEALISNRQPLDVVVLDNALERLSELDPRKARVVELRFFAGLTIDETGEVLEVSHATVERDLKLARAWLARELGPDSEGAQTEA